MNNAAMDVQFFSHYRMHPFTSENLGVTYGGRFGGIVLYFLSEHLSLSKFLILLLLCTHSWLQRNLVLMGMGKRRLAIGREVQSFGDCLGTQVWAAWFCRKTQPALSSGNCCMPFRLCTTCLQWQGQKGHDIQGKGLRLHSPRLSCSRGSSSPGWKNRWLPFWSYNFDYAFLLSLLKLWSLGPLTVLGFFRIAFILPSRCLWTMTVLLQMWIFFWSLK